MCTYLAGLQSGSAAGVDGSQCTQQFCKPLRSGKLAETAAPLLCRYGVRTLLSADVLSEQPLAAAVPQKQ